MELINGTIHETSLEPLKIVSFKCKDKIVRAAANQILEDMAANGTPIIDLNSEKDCITAGMPASDAGKFMSTVTCTDFYEHVMEIAKRRDHILETMASIATQRNGTPTYHDEFLYVDDETSYMINVPYNHDGSVDENELWERFRTLMHTAAPLRYDWHYNELAKKMHDLFRKEIFFEHPDWEE